MHYDSTTNQSPIVHVVLRTIKNISYDCKQCGRKTAADISITLDIEQDLLISVSTKKRS